ncbi:glycosyltransferase family 8 protein [Mycena maculata]|uniref:Glycosyltransferase family 8 protein n=1 Tax=Mycena maculata TaxID=230809 RepID=A0AAD7JE27_9AGAR|nr:glycosyltransferase family 8 protein [Mycena maculata]
MANAEEKGYLFTSTQDWVSDKKETWRRLFPFVCQNPRVLEIGSWEGRSAVFLLTELCSSGGEIVCVDHFDLLTSTAGQERYRKLTHNLGLTKKQFRVMDEFSIPALTKLLAEETACASPGYDWIYIDGSHEASDTFLDGELAWRLAKKGAVIIFDDYHWDAEPESSTHHPKRGIDAFLLLHRGEFELLSAPSDYQVILKKTAEMRIGFLVKPKPSVAEEEMWGGMKLAIAADSKYAMGAAVAIRSAVETTCTVEDPSRLSIYVLDCGLDDDEKRMIQESIPGQGDVTLVFLTLPDNSLAKKLGGVWAKVDAIRLLPVERVIYLDADVLVLRNLKDLWKTDLEGKTLGAARDVGFPNGHDSIRGPYFNAGVILMDVALARKNWGELEALSKQDQLPFLDQDALNIHFREEWIAIDQEWNAQGLGTYADLHTVDREELAANIAAMKARPRIVHFTGPVHPTMAEVLNPFVKYSAKPWGYASAPNHPFGSTWWKVLGRTAWKGVQTSEGYIQSCKARYEEAVETAKYEFEKVLEKTTINAQVSGS